MSNRQERNRRKAQQRRARVLGDFPGAPGFSVYADTVDFGNQLFVGVTRHSDGARWAVGSPVDRLWRRMEERRNHMVDKLMQCFSEEPETTPSTPKDC